MTLHADADRALDVLEGQLRELPERRGVIPLLHSFLRDCILDGRMPPGATISQLDLARRLGVSRTPVREVLRMLEEEGFIEAATNRRSRVAGFAAEQLDSDYASRILLESLAFDLTVRDLSPRDAASLLDLNNEMRKNAQNDRIDQWFSIHAGFHERLTCGASPPVLKQVRTYRDRSIRYIRTIQAASPGTWMTDGESEHSAIVEALMDGDRALARTTLAEHLANTAYRVLSHLAAGYDPVAVKGALSLVSDRGPLPDHPELGRQVG